jgi:hypothetical protein
MLAIHHILCPRGVGRVEGGAGRELVEQNAA